MHQITLIRFILSNISADPGVPRKPSLDVPQSPSHGVPQAPPTELLLVRVGTSSEAAVLKSGDEEDESGDEEDEREQEKEDIERTPEQILEAAGVDMASLEGLSCDERQSCTSGAAYRVILVIYLQFLSCVMREKYEAARLLCEKVLQLEPTNQFAAEYLPVIVERLQINIELSSDESDDNGHTSSDDSHTSSNGQPHHHTPDPNKTTPTKPHPTHTIVKLNT
eukprot:Em0007g20a